MPTRRALECGFKTICKACNKIVDIRSDGEVFRYVPHAAPKQWYHPVEVTDEDLRCPNSDTKFEPS